MKTNAFSFSQQLHLAMLPHAGHTLIVDNEIMLGDNLAGAENSISNEAGNWIASGYPFKISFTLLLFCRQGRMRIRVNLNDYVMAAGDLLLLLPNSIGECLEISEDCRAAIIAFSNIDYIPKIELDKLLMQKVDVSNHYKVSLDAHDTQEFVALYTQLWERMENPRYTPFKSVIINSYVQIFFCNVLSIVLSQTASGPELPKSRSMQMYDRFIKEVRRHYARERSISFYADKLCVTPKYLSQVIYRVSGRYAGDWIRDYVIFEAKALLKSGEYTVQQVSEMLHFPNPSFFGKYFKASTGLSPLKYRNG